MKKDRQELILEIISRYPIRTQQQLQEHLKRNGITCTQATLSRDCHALGLIRITNPDGEVHWIDAKLLSGNSNLERLLKIFKTAVLSAETARNIIVIKTMPGLAGAVCSFMDKLERPTLVGSLAGNDTVLLIMKDNESADELLQFIQDLLKGKTGANIL